jgi:hypothetical protein
MAVHFEASPSHLDHSPCLVCAHLMGRYTAIPAFDRIHDESRTVRTTIPELELALSESSLWLPDQRGPPVDL